MSSVLAVDVGSTRTHAAVIDVEALSCQKRIDFYNTEFDYQFFSTIKSLASISAGIRRVNITSCVKDLADKAAGFCVDAKLFDEVNIVKAHGGLPISIGYDNPRTLGTDRLCNALACAALFGDRTCILIDAGTAITIDRLIDGRTLDCGMILPGIKMQLESLHKNTDTLPLVEKYNESELSLPSKSTEECIKAGVLYGTAGAVAACVDKLSGDNTMIILTGGDVERIKQLLNCSTMITLPHLTLIGAATYSGLGK